jgi:hypothetical protein
LSQPGPFAGAVVLWLDGLGQSAIAPHGCQHADLSRITLVADSRRKVPIRMEEHQMVAVKTLGLGIAVLVSLLTLDVAGPPAFGAATKPKPTTHATTQTASSASSTSSHRVGGTARTTFARPSRATNTQQVHQDERQFSRDTKQVTSLKSGKSLNSAQKGELKRDLEQENQIKKTDPLAARTVLQKTNSGTAGGQNGTGGTNSGNATTNNSGTNNGAVNKVVRQTGTSGNTGTTTSSGNTGTQSGTNGATTKTPYQQYAACRDNSSAAGCGAVRRSYKDYENCKRNSSAQGCGGPVPSNMTFDQFECRKNPAGCGSTPGNPPTNPVLTTNSNNPGTQNGNNGTQTGNNGTQNGNKGTQIGNNGTQNGNNGTQNGNNGKQTGNNGTQNGNNGTQIGNNGATTTTPLKNGPVSPVHSPVNQPTKGPVILIANISFPFIAGPKRIWRDGGWRSFLPFAGLDAVADGGAYYYPSAYVSTGRSYCSGLTPDGCHLNWQLVGFEGGGSAFQCVQFCPRPGQPPPQHFVALKPPPAPSGRCEVAIFADPAFGGASSPSTTDQPSLGEVGWKDQISSLQIKAGVWDFFGGDQFQGESMRLQPGQYPQLSPEFTKHIGSFMCVQGT